MPRQEWKIRWLKGIAMGKSSNRYSDNTIRLYARRLQEVAEGGLVNKAASDEDEPLAMLNELCLDAAGAIDWDADAETRLSIVGSMALIFSNACLGAEPGSYACEIFWREIAMNVSQGDPSESGVLGSLLTDCLGHGSETFQAGAIEGLSRLGRFSDAYALDRLSVESPSGRVRELAREAADKLFATGQVR